MKKNIVFVIISLFGGGAERVVSLLSNCLFQRGWKVTIIVYQRKEREYQIAPEIEIKTLPSLETRNPIVKRFRQIRKLREMLDGINPDIVLPFLAIPVYQTFFATRGKKYKVYATVRNNPNQYPEQRGLRTVVNFCTSKMDGIIYQTEEQIKFFPKVTDSFVLHNPVNSEMLLTSYIYDDRVKCIATFGRLSKQKNHPLLIKAFSKIAVTYPDITLRIYGEGEEKNNIEDLIRELDLINRVILMGNTKEVKESLMKTDIFVLPSDFEGLPNALIEAMAVGVPCISTTCPTGPSDLIKNGENGLLVPCGDVDAMSLAIEKLVCSPELRCKLGRAAREIIQKEYTIDYVINQFEEEIQKRM